MTRAIETRWTEPRSETMAISIRGQSYEEVFGNIARDERFDEAEKDSALAIAAYYRARSEWEGALRTALEDATRDAGALEARYARERIEAEFLESRPRLLFRGHHVDDPHSPAGQEWRTIAHGRLKWTVWPFTAGDSMNVAVEPRADAPTA
jgi:hypothetical protein